MLRGLSEEQHADIDIFLENFPDIEITFDAKVHRSTALGLPRAFLAEHSRSTKRPLHDAQVEDEEDVQEGDVLNLKVKVERKHLREDPDWADSDDEDDEPVEAIFEKELEGLEEGSDEYEEKKEELMDEWCAPSPLDSPPHSSRNARSPRHLLAIGATRTSSGRRRSVSARSGATLRLPRARAPRVCATREPARP